MSFLLVRRGGIRKSLIDQHAANLGGRAQELNRTKYRRVELTEWRTAPPSEPSWRLGTLIRARKVLPSPLWKPQPPWLIFAWWLGPPLAVLLAILWLWKMLAPLMH